ncbi:MAG: class I SAM-dependent methyltransferase [Actinomycetota bacterium]|nr:class I SAM-dependent methyltransferase [Actinomycetota bacterium]
MSESPGQRYERYGTGYGRTRQTEPRIAACIRDALGGAESVVNVGAGTGSYEPADLAVVAVEPSRTMAAQRPPDRPALIAPAEHLPLADASVDAAMAVITIHHWTDQAKGVAEMRRVARDRVLVLTLDPVNMKDAWTRRYWPDLLEMDSEFPAPEAIAEWMGGGTISTVPVPNDCVDLYIETLRGRPELLLDPGVRANCSGFARMDDELEARGAERLAADLRTGAWGRTHGAIQTAKEYDGGLRLVVGSASG